MRDNVFDFPGAGHAESMVAQIATLARAFAREAEGMTVSRMQSYLKKLADLETGDDKAGVAAREFVISIFETELQARIGGKPVRSKD